MAERNEAFWQRVDELRGRMTIKEMAERAGISEPTLQTTRTVKAQPKFQMALSIDGVRDVLNIPPDKNNGA